MARVIWIVAAFLCICCIVALLIAPFVDPPVTRLLSDSLEFMMLCWLLAAACILFVTRHRLTHVGAYSLLPPPHHDPPPRHPLTLNSILQQ
jgi:hypothetical protein